ncbi:MAG TPA: TonB-dependent receptor, partial [bacterium]|nr:TonB-dependent receptor [bacterium]
WLKLRGTLVTYSATYPASAAYSNVYYIPYRARMRVPLQATMQLPSNFELTLDGELSGPRSVDYTTNTELGGYNLLNATISRSFRERITILLSASNILNESYTHWEQYPKMGIQVFLGVRAKL